MIPGSYSFLRDLMNCPQKAFRKFIKRDLPKEDTPELRDGIIAHEILAGYINGKSTRLPVELEAHAKPLIAQGARAEVKMGMTKDVQASDFWGDPWFRGVADVLVIDPPAAVILDWKTGKPREDDRELKCLSMLVKANYPDINRVYGAYVWLKEGRMGTWRDLTDVNQTYHGTVAAMEDAKRYEREDEWPVKPNALCSWCPVVDCRFNSNPRLDKIAQPAMIAK